MRWFVLLVVATALAVDAGPNLISRAFADYDEAIHLDPKLAISYLSRGNAYLARGDNDRAIADYTQAIRLDPQDAVAYGNRGIAYYDKGDNDRAIADHDQAIRLDPKDAAAYNDRGNAYQAKGDNERAIADYDEAIRLGGDLSPFRFYVSFFVGAPHLSLHMSCLPCILRALERKLWPFPWVKLSSSRRPTK